jgi:hypothetical protein
MTAEAFSLTAHIGRPRRFGMWHLDVVSARLWQRQALRRLGGFQKNSNTSP